MNAIAKPMVPGSELTSDDWCTPSWLTDLLGKFDLDPCWNPRSTVNARVAVGKVGPTYAEDGCGLEYEWGKCSVFVNPPYSNVLPWATKLALHGGAWCALVKLDPTTRWFDTLMSANPIIAPFRKRITFAGEKPMTANFPSVLVFKRWWPSDELAAHLWLPRWS